MLQLDTNQQNKYSNLLQTNRELCTSLKERQQALLLQTSLLRDLDDPAIINNLQLLNKLLCQQKNVSDKLVKSMLDSQIAKQKQAQQQDIITQYEQRIFEIRINMIEKQNVLSSEMRTKRLIYMTTKNNIRKFNNCSNETDHLLRLQSEYYELVKQTEILKENLKQKTTGSTDNSSEEENQKQQQYVERKAVSKSRAQSLVNDKLIQKFYAHFDAQLKLQNQLKAQYKQLMKQYQELSHEHENKIFKYKQFSTLQNS